MFVGGLMEPEARTGAEGALQPGHYMRLSSFALRCVNLRILAEAEAEIESARHYLTDRSSGLT